MNEDAGDERAHLCICHFFALQMIEQRFVCPPFLFGRERATFVNSVRIISQIHGRELGAWRKAHPREAHA